MSSSASTIAVEAASASSTTTFTADIEDELPSNSEILASVPLPSSSIFNGATKLSFEYDSSVDFGYSFVLRDSRGCVQAIGEVDRYSNTKLRNVNGTEMLTITKRNEANVTELAIPRDVRAFEISQQNGIIGTVKVTDNGSLRINHNSSYPQICVLSLKIGEFAIYRSNSMSSPICNILMPHADVYSSEKFIGTINLGTGITIEEQLLCTAAMIAFKVTMKQSTSIADIASKCFGCCLAICATIFIIVALCTFGTSQF